MAPRTARSPSAASRVRDPGAAGARVSRKLFDASDGVWKPLSPPARPRILPGLSRRPAVPDTPSHSSDPATHFRARAVSVGRGEGSWRGSGSVIGPNQRRGAGQGSWRGSAVGRRRSSSNGGVMWSAGPFGCSVRGSGYLIAAARRAVGQGGRALKAPDFRAGKGSRRVPRSALTVPATGGQLGLPNAGGARAEWHAWLSAAARVTGPAEVSRDRQTLGNVPTEASFPARGSFPFHHQTGNSPSEFFEPSIGVVQASRSGI